jgi:MarR family transcriptional regulator for hemolysin
MANKNQEAARVLLCRSPRPANETPPMILNDVSRLFFAKVRSLEPEGVLSQHSARAILRLLVRTDGMHQGELARHAHLSAPTVSATLRRMEEEGLIERRGCERDGRAMGVYLTAEGRARHKEMLGMLRSVESVLMQGLDEQECAVLTGILVRMRENILNDLRGDEEVEP